MKNFYKKSLLILTISSIYLSAMDIPVNPAHKGAVSNWLFMGPIKENTETILKSQALSESVETK